MAMDTPKIPSIKLKLSLPSTLTTNGTTPATPTPNNGHGAPSTPSSSKSVKRGRPSKPVPASKLRAEPASANVYEHVEYNDKVDFTQPEAGPSTAPIASSLPLSSSISTPKSATPRPRTKKNSRKQSLASRPSALPAHLTPRSSVSFSSPPANGFPLSFDDSADIDPLSLQASPAEGDVSVVGTPYGDGSVEGLDTPGSGGRGRAASERKWMRIKRPFRELAGKIMVELRRKDEYGIFLEPVNTLEYPDYLDRVGGADKMMDLGTMQSKIDGNEYDGFDQFEADLRTLVAAAHAFNPPGSVPYNAAGRMLNVGVKHIGRSRPLVRTPSPSPTRYRTDSTPLSESLPNSNPSSGWAGRRFTTQRVTELATSTIPEPMLSFPPNSLQALAVGWNLNGGKRVWARKFVRGRERFSGKWRDWAPDGSRDIAEMDEPEAVLDGWRLVTGEEWRKNVVDWKGLRDDGAWWDVDGIGGPTGQAPISGVPRPRPEPLQTRALSTLDWGVYPKIEQELASLVQKAALAASATAGTKRPKPKITDPLEILSDHLRPVQTRSKPALPTRADLPVQSFENVYAPKMAKVGPGEWVRNMVLGDTSGEAYVRSVERFVKGAMALAEDGVVEKDVGRMEGVKEENGVRGVGSERIRLDEWVREKYRGGILGDDPEQTAVRGVISILDPSNSSVPTSSTVVPGYASSSEILTHAKALHDLANLTYLNSADHPLDLIPLLHDTGDFGYPGMVVDKKVEGSKEALAVVGGWIKDAAERMTKEGEEGGKGKGKSTGKRAREDEAEGEEEDAVKKMKVEKRVEEEIKAEVERGVKDKIETLPEAQPNGHAEPNVDSTDRSVSDDSTTISNPNPNSNPNSNSNPNPNPNPDPNPNTEANSNPNSNSTSSSSTETESEEMRQIRLEILALAKFYPLASLKKMDKEDADRLLPPHVRKLMSKPENQVAPK